MRKILPALLFLAAMSSLAAAEPQPKDQQIADLEARIARLEQSAEAMRREAAEAMSALQAARAEIEEIKSIQENGAETRQEVDPVPSQIAAPTANNNAFNPAISIVLDGTYAHHSLDPDAYFRSGFPLAGEAGPGAEGLSLGESEIALSANVDDKFYGQLTLAVESEEGEDGIGIEEAFVDTTALPAGFALRMGRFFSNIGYLNNHHAHADKFTDRPLAYQAFLGNQYGDDGVQLRWIAPSDLFIELGGEVLRGGGFPSGGAARNGVGVATAFAHVGGDIGVESSWLAGLSVLRSRTMDGDDGFSGHATVYIADATWKWAPDGNTKDGGVEIRGEYFIDDRDGRYVDPEDPATDLVWDGRRRGAYVEGVYRINRNWDTGYRYDRLWADDSGPVASGFDPSRHSAMLTWRNSEFSLLRLQLSQDHPNPDDNDFVLSLQYQMSLGAHGAHKF